jgi:hypothetical protein
LRTWLRRWQAMKRAGRPCRVLARRSPVNRMRTLRPPRARRGLKRAYEASQGS